MKKFIVGIVIVLFVAVWINWSVHIVKKQQAMKKPYSVTIIHGTPMISYSATLQVDSLKYISKESMIVYLNGSSLWVKG